MIHLHRLHAKIYVAEFFSHAIVTSANLTRGGLDLNYEYGASFRDTEIVKVVRRGRHIIFGAWRETKRRAAQSVL